MNAIFAAGLFDNPWLVAVFIIVGMISNWLMKRRQQKEAEERPEGEPPPLPEEPKKGFDLEAALRRLVDEESPPKQPAPPPIIPRTQPGGTSSKPDWQDDEFDQPERNWTEETREGRESRETAGQMPPPLRSIPAVLVRAEPAILSPTEEQAQAARRFAQLNEQGRHPAIVVHGGHSRPGTRTAYWRNPQSARQAFVASLVFGPPMGLEN